MSREVAAIGDVAEVAAGGGAPQDAKAYTIEGTPFVRAGSLKRLLGGDSETSLERLTDEVAKQHKLRKFPLDTVIFAKSGMSATKGLIYRLREDAYIVNHLAALVPSKRILPEFLEHSLRIFSPTRLIQDAAYPSIRLSEIAAAKIPLPPVEEQRRIVTVLDKAEELRAKRRAALVELDTLTQSIFLEMFGDPRKKGTTGSTPTKECLMGGLTRIRTGKLDANAADEDGALPFFTCAAEPLRINTPAFDCKAVLVAGNGDLNVKYYEGKFNAYQRTYVIESLDERVLAPKFLYAFLNLYIGELRKQAIGGVIKYIKLPYLTEAVMQLPPPSAQQDFVRRLTAVEALRDKHRTALAELDALFASLQHRAFRGEL